MLGVMLNALESQSLAEEMAQQVKTLSAKYDNLSSAPRAHMIEGGNRVRQAVPRPHTCAVALLFLPKEMNFKKKPNPNPIYSKKVVTEKLQLQICVICNHYMWLLRVCAVTSAREDCHFFLWVLLASSSLTYCLGLTDYPTGILSSLLISPK